MDLLMQDSQDELATLISYSEQQFGSSGYPCSHNSFAIAIFSVHPRSGALMISRMVEVSYLAVRNLSKQAGEDLTFISILILGCLTSLVSLYPLDHRPLSFDLRMSS